MRSGRATGPDEILVAFWMFSGEAGLRYYYNKVTRTSKWRMPDEFKLAHEKDTISHVSDFGSIAVVKTSSPGADGLLVSAHGAKSSPTTVSPAANLPTIVASESLSLSGKVSSSMIETVKMKNSSEPASPAVANSEKIRIAVTLGNSVVPPVSETTTTQDAVVYGDGFSLENRENVKKDAAITEIGGATLSDEKTEAKSAFKTLLESVNIGSDCMWDQVIRAVISDRRYGALKSLCEQKQAFNDEHAKALEEQKRNKVEYLEFLKSSDFIKASSQWWKVQDHLETDERCSRLEKIDRLEIFQEYIRDLESKEGEQRKLQMEELRKAERKNRDEFRKLMEEHITAGILNAKTNWHDYYIKIKDFAAYLAASSNTLGSIVKNLFTDVMDELEKQTFESV
ncbi:pre-mRNA-processing protein 40A-like [Capsicum annuum]|uniref:pre-mRNA-processing protein 40A-like n=1 Tax=Capsicum annuum TaxID=4072 RepID=UPI001FB17789|nr:pre-mRNA-processing protein 40A-like [Capsicum annuum]